MIVIDTREPKEIAEYLKAYAVPYQSTSLVIGDYVINQIIVERKTFSDFFISYKTGRLYKQMLQLYLHKNSVLLLEGFDLEYIQEKQAFYTILVKILLNYKIQIFFTQNMEHTAAFLIALERNSKNVEALLLPKLLNHQYFTIQQRKKHILCCFPFIGDKKAKKILEQCHSLRTLFTATDIELQCYGIGKKGQKAFEEILD